MLFKKNKAFAIMLLLFFWHHKALAQKPVNTSYFDKAGNLSSVEDAYYYRETTDTAELYRSYYSLDSSLYFVGKIISAKDSSDQKNIYKGLCTWYYGNGNKKKEYSYNDNGRLNGVCTDYFETGKPKKTVVFDNGKLKQGFYLEYGANGAIAKVFEDDFTDNRNNWQLTLNDTGSVKIKIGGFEMHSAKPTGFVRRLATQIKYTAFSYEGIINSNYLSDSTKAGLIFDLKDDDNYNYFLVSKHKCYIGKVTNGKELKKINSFKTYSLKGNSTNKVKVIYSKNNLFYSINDEILFSETGTNLPESNFGLAIKSTGVVFFDKITIREYENEITIEPLYAKIKNDNNFIISNKDYGIQSASIGLILNSEGLIACSSEIVKEYSEILVETFVNDSLKRFNAEVVIKNEACNLAILKITDLGINKLNSIAYAFCDKSSIELESELKTIYFTKSDINNNKTNIISGNLKTKARFENLSNFFETSLQTEGIALGGPVFTSQGELLGIVTTPSIRYNTKATKLTMLEQLLFFSNQKFKKPLKLSEPVSFESISKNIVLIKIK